MDLYLILSIPEALLVPQQYFLVLVLVYRHQNATWHLQEKATFTAGTGLFHQQNRKVPTLKGRQYNVLQFLGSKAEQYNLDPNLGASLYSHSRW